VSSDPSNLEGGRQSYSIENGYVSNGPAEVAAKGRSDREKAGRRKAEYVSNGTAAPGPDEAWGRSEARVEEVSSSPKCHILKTRKEEADEK
jgi:hypothetical protein